MFAETMGPLAQGRRDVLIRRRFVTEAMAEQVFATYSDYAQHERSLVVAHPECRTSVRHIEGR
jgi:hypothetical protein